MISMTKLQKADREARTVPAKVAKSDRARTIEQAIEKVSAKARISFRRAVRG
jgi:hypothetical protein